MSKEVTNVATSETPSNVALPQNWESTTLDSIVRTITYGHTASSTFELVGPKFLRITDIQNNSVQWDRVPYCECDNVSKYSLKTGDIVIARTGATTGKNYLLEHVPQPTVFASYLIRLETFDEPTPKYISTYMKSASYWQQITTVSKGSAQPGANASILSKLTIPIAPKEEQTRIVTAIELLQQRSSRARTLLTEVEPLIEKLRQSTLQSAFSGRLTADWRAKNPDVEPADQLLARIRVERIRLWEESECEKFQKKNTVPKNYKWKLKYKEPWEFSFERKLPEIPESWTWVNIDTLTTWVTYGFTRPMPHVDKGPMIVTAKNVHNDKLRLENIVFTTEEAFEKLNQKDMPRAGDILIIKDGATTGRAALVPQNIEPFCINQSVGVMWLKHSPMNRKFLLRWIQSPLIQSLIQEAMAGMAMPHLSVTDFRKMPVPIPPLAEQQEINKLIELAFNNLKELEIDSKLIQTTLNQLDQSILTKAFRGELVPQDPNDEPAFELLARIRAAREAEAATKKASKKKTTRKKKKASE